ncbi:MAG: hypothetical protein ACR2OE_03125 [Thermomicrobiales bacterium]
MHRTAHYPTPQHERAAHAIVNLFARHDEPDAVLLVNSCARGKATLDSCLDIIVLVPEGVDTGPLEMMWQHAYRIDPVFADLRGTGIFSVVHLDVVGGTFAPDSHPADEYPDAFEIVIGNYFAYSLPL